MCAMGLVIALSNILVQKPVGEYLTYAAFTYPIAFLITDYTNRISGAVMARRVVFVGFMIGIILSLHAAEQGASTWRITVASGSAFLVAQLLDVTIFDRLRQSRWWKAPVISSVVGSVVDTAIFFFIAFSAVTYALSKDENTWALEMSPLLGMWGQHPYWMSLAVADFGIKCLMVIVLLIPYRIALKHIRA